MLSALLSFTSFGVMSSMVVLLKLAGEHGAVFPGRGNQFPRVGVQIHRYVAPEIDRAPEARVRA